MAILQVACLILAAGHAPQYEPEVIKVRAQPAPKPLPAPLVVKGKRKGSAPNGTATRLLQRGGPKPGASK